MSWHSDQAEAKLNTLLADRAAGKDISDSSINAQATILGMQKRHDQKLAENPPPQMTFQESVGFLLFLAVFVVIIFGSILIINWYNQSNKSSSTLQNATSIVAPPQVISSIPEIKFEVGHLRDAEFVYENAGCDYSILGASDGGILAKTSLDYKGIVAQISRQNAVFIRTSDPESSNFIGSYGPYTLEIQRKQLITQLEGGSEHAGQFKISENGSELFNAEILIKCGS